MPTSEHASVTIVLIWRAKLDVRTIVSTSTKVCVIRLGRFAHFTLHSFSFSSKGYSCRCPDGFTLQNDYKTCKEDVSEKEEEATPQTTLEAGVEREDSDEDSGDNEVEEPEESIVECSPDDHEHCSPGNCVVEGRDKACSCPSGFVQKAKKCVDYDECEHGDHQCSHSCHNTAGGYRCSCPYGLKLSDDEQTCDDFDECSQDEDICGSLECRNTYGSYKCVCPEGHEIDENGKCRKPNLCDNNNGGCSQ
jgi:fibrillin 1